MFEYLIDDKFLSSDDKIAVGVSGGADSMLLLWALIDKQKQLGFELIAVHINHGIRNETSDRDQKFVEDFCKKRKIKQISIKIDTKKLKSSEKLTLEEAARALRYDAFNSVMKQQKCNKLFLAHHKNDQAETILMHIFRGCGILGASGMRQNDKIVRPLLKLSKSEILTICKEHRIDFVVDETNESNDYSRNYVRNKIIPAIEKIYPNAVDAVVRFGERCEEIQNHIESMASENLIEETDGEVLLKDSAFGSQSFVVKEYIKRAFEKIGIFEDVELKHYNAVANLQKLEVNKQIDLPHKVIAKRTYKGIKFFKEKKQINKNIEYQFVIGKIELEGVGTIETNFVSPSSVEYGNGILFVDYNKISNEAVWRTRKLGDVFSKLGTGCKKLNDYFTDKKVETSRRDVIPVLAIENSILVVAGEDISENVKIDGDTDKIVSIKFIKN